MITGFIDFVLLLVAFCIAAAITRLIFSIPTILKNLQATNKLLAIIAKNTGGNEQSINDILDTAGVSGLRSEAPASDSENSKMSEYKGEPDKLFRDFRSGKISEAEYNQYNTQFRK